MENPTPTDVVPDSSLPTLSDYLKTGKGLINLFSSAVVFYLVLVKFPYISSDITRIYLAAVFAVGIFLNQWKAAISWSVVSGLVIWLLMRAILNWARIDVLYFSVRSIGQFVIVIVSYGFVLGRPGNAFIRTLKDSGKWNLALGVHRLLAIVGEKLYERVDESFSLGNSLPPFIDPGNEAFVRINSTGTQISTSSRGSTDSIAPSAAVMALPLYVVTIIIEAFGAITRSVLFSAVFLPIAWLFISDNSYSYGFKEVLIAALIPGLLLGFFPILMSLGHYLFPFFRTGAGADAERFGARRPTRDEMENFIEAGVYIRERAEELGKVPASPGEWMVIDNNVSAESYTIGSTIYVTSYAAKSEHLAGLVAHELGHLAHRDGDVILALRRLVIPFAYYFGIDRQPLPAGSIFATGGAALGAQQVITDDMKLFYRMKMLPLKLSMSFWFGGLGMFFMGRQWANFWRFRDFRADEYAASIGLADDLMSVLEVYEHVDVAQPYLLTNRPYTAQRLDRLKG